MERDVSAANEWIRVLTDHRFEVDLATTPGNAVQRKPLGRYDAVVIGRMTPDDDRSGVGRVLRDAGYAGPVIVVGATEAPDGGRRGSQAQAAGPRTRSCGVDQLMCRLLYPARLWLDDLELDMPGRIAYRAGRAIPLRPIEYRLLAYMFRHSRRVLTRERLFEAIWGFRHNPGLGAIDTHLARLRRKIDLPHETRLVRAVRNDGYWLGA
ncbi:winged helix-turn-helix transcriptional regulator [Burkholderia alba]|uniref:winged helix-turn-helix transcriptional regulator n=1 Tax=Burkholderia alba TaxID=2683677 RepID=UPI002B059912|nr:response regulator transcription factor [Burkholderia alba]